MQQDEAGEPTVYRPPEETPTIVTAGGPSQPLQLTPGTILGGRYRVVSLIGRGGMGEVYRADDLKLGQVVALKFLGTRGDARLERRLHEEVRIGREVSHPNVCRIHDIVEVDAHLFITMEFVDGEDLASLLRRVGRLPAEKAVAVARDLCAGLAAAHDRDVIHRDLKPGNVMIDGRGRARITDFGLAVAEERRADEQTAGTPAYMSPEQLDGKAASKQSDIYALGLILYEAFTGKRAFATASLTDLVVRQHALDFSRPSSIVRDIDAAIERLIVRCLDPEPGRRPASVSEILHSFPGGDPLAAAIAAGETPSPAMVAAASERGELSRRAAWSILSLCIAALITYAALTPRTMLIRTLPVLKSPDALNYRIDEILSATKQPLSRGDAGAFFFTDDVQLKWKRGPSSLGIAPMLYHFRQSPQAMEARSFEHRIYQNDPPLVVAGMADVIVDASGRLVELIVIPPPFEPPPKQIARVDWTPFLRFAGVSSALSPAPSNWAAPVDSDEKQAWTVGSDGTRIEAAAYHGKPVWFAVIPPWQDAAQSRNREPQSLIDFDVVSGTGTIALLLFSMIAAVLLAIRNLRRGQGDRRGATSLALFFFATCFITYVVRAHHPPDALVELKLLADIASLSAFMALVTWIAYVAVEPLVRRRWPRMLIGWSRLLAGRLRDPMVGRDFLFGTTFSVVGACVWQLTALAAGALPLNTVGSTLTESRHVAYFAGFSIMQAIAGGLIVATSLLTLHVATRSLRLSVVIYFIASTLILLAGSTGPLWMRAAFAAFVVAGALTIVLRFGLLAGAIVGAPMMFLRAAPVTLDTGAWYFGRSLFVLLLLAALAFYGFFVSLGDKRWLPEIAVEE